MQQLIRKIFLFYFLRSVMILTQIRQIMSGIPGAGSHGSIPPPARVHGYNARKKCLSDESHVDFYCIVVDCGSKVHT